MTDWPSIIDEIIAAGVTKAEIGRRLDVPKQTIQRWHDGTGRPKDPHDRHLKALHRSLTSQKIRTYEGAIVATSTLLRT